jgi:hypothetical protein
MKKRSGFHAQDCSTKALDESDAFLDHPFTNLAFCRAVVRDRVGVGYSTCACSHLISEHKVV